MIAALGLRSCHLGNQLGSPLAHPEQVPGASDDLSAFATWAGQIAEGDWLGRSFFHPYMDWMQERAPIEKFEQWWGGKEVFHQNPLFPYLLAVSYAITGSSVPLLVLQVLLSTLVVLLVYDIGRRLLDVRAGLIAAGLCAFWAPAVVLDSLLLRASLNTSLSVLSIWLLFRLRDKPFGASAFGTGVCVAASYLLRPTGLALMVGGPVLLLLLFPDLRRSVKRWGPAFLAGVVLCIGPFVVRNLVVGAPALKFSTRGPETVIQANSKSTDPGFMWLPPKEEFVAYMDAGHRSIGAALSTCIDSWPGGFPQWLGHVWEKALCAFGDYEYPNNVNFYYYGGLTPGLSLLPTFGWIAGLGLLGLVLLAVFGRERKLALIGLFAIAALFVGTILGFALGRYRLPLAVLMTIPAGASVSLFVAWFRSGERSMVVRAAVCSLLAVGISAYSFTVAPTRTWFSANGDAIPESAESRRCKLDMHRLRAQEYVHSAHFLRERGDAGAAVRLLRDYLQSIESFAEARTPALRSLPTPSAWLVLQNELKTNYWRIEGALRALDEKRAAEEVRRKAEAIEKQLKPFLGGK